MAETLYTAPRIEGLEELRAAIEEQRAYLCDLAIVSNFGYSSDIVYPTPPKSDVSLLSARYRRAAAYLKAEEMYHSDNTKISELGLMYMEIIAEDDDNFPLPEELVYRNNSQ